MDLKSVDNFFFWNGSVRLWLENVVGLQYVTPSHIVIIYVIASKTRDKWGTQIQEYLGPKLLLWGKKFMFTTPILVYLWFKYITKWHIYVFYFFLKWKNMGLPELNLTRFLTCQLWWAVFSMKPFSTWTPTWPNLFAMSALGKSLSDQYLELVYMHQECQDSFI